MNKKAQLGLGLLGFLIILIISALIGGFCWTYSINTIGHLVGKSISIKFWQGALLGFVPGIGQLSIPIAVLIWLISLFL